MIERDGERWGEETNERREEKKQGTMRQKEKWSERKKERTICCFCFYWSFSNSCFLCNHQQFHVFVWIINNFRIFFILNHKYWHAPTCRSEYLLPKISFEASSLNAYHVRKESAKWVILQHPQNVFRGIRKP